MIDFAGIGYDEAKVFINTLLLTQPRMIALFVMLPIFSASILPGMLRYGVAAAMTLIAVPMLIPTMPSHALGGIELGLIVVKEAFVGVSLGFLMALPFWVFEAVGFLIDNQRGASIASTLNPLTGNDTSPFGMLFNQAFMVFFMINGGFQVLLDIVYMSFRMWPIMSWAPSLSPQSAPLWLDQLGRLMRLALLYGAPVLIAMFFAETGLALIGRFVPQLQVFFLAMPIKSGLALYVLIMYVGTLFGYGTEMIHALSSATPFLDGLWRAGGA